MLTAVVKKKTNAPRIMALKTPCGIYLRSNLGIVAIPLNGVTYNIKTNDTFETIINAVKTGRGEDYIEKKCEILYEGDEILFKL